MNATLSDHIILQGEWLQVSVEENGVSDPPDEYGNGAITTFHQNRFEVRTVAGDLLLAGVFELDPESAPKAVDWIDSIGRDAGKRLPAIYRLEKDSFVFIAADEGAPRPLTFQTGPGQTMRAFIRKPKP